MIDHFDHVFAQELPAALEVAHCQSELVRVRNIAYAHVMSGSVAGFAGDIGRGADKARYFD